jgi:hypothetical protein
MSPRTLHIEPTTDPDDGSEYGILDQDGNELAVVYGGKPLAQLFATAPDMQAALAYADEQAPANDATQSDSDLIHIEVTVGWVREVRDAIAKAQGKRA